MDPLLYGDPLYRPEAAPTKSTQKKKAPDEKSSKLGSLFHSATEHLHKSVEFIKNPIDSDWRKNQKYRYVMDSLLTGLEKNLGEFQEGCATFGMLATLQQIKKNPVVEGSGKPVPGSVQECREHLMAALSYLAGGKEGRFETERERYKAAMESFHKALTSRYYLDQVEGKNAEQLKALEQGDPIVGTLHAMALAQFSQVNTQKFTGDLTRQLADNGGYDKTDPGPSHDHPLKRALAALARFNEGIHRADTKHKMSAIANIGPVVKGHHELATLDPLITGGNPANIKGIIKTNGKELTLIRTPTPTIGPKVNPMFRAYLLALKSRGKSHLYVSLQNRLTPSKLESATARLQAYSGFPREDRRTAGLEALNEDPDLKGAIHVFTLDKNSGFYWQNDSKRGARKLFDFLNKNNFLTREQRNQFDKQLKHGYSYPEAVDGMLAIYADRMKEMGTASQKLAQWHIMKNRTAFESEFKKKIWAQEGSYYLPTEYKQSPHKEAIERIIDTVGDKMFHKVVLTPRERQDFIEIVHALMSAYFLKTTNADCFNTTCKDCVDRGGAQTNMMLFSFLMVEEADHPERRERLAAEMESLPVKLNEDALFAKKRGILSERGDRLAHALETAVDGREVYVGLLKGVMRSGAEVVLTEINEQKASLENSGPRIKTGGLPIPTRFR